MYKSKLAQQFSTFTTESDYLQLNLIFVSLKEDLRSIVILLYNSIILLVNESITLISTKLIAYEYKDYVVNIFRYFIRVPQ